MSPNATLPDSWIAKIFEQMSAMYGAKFTTLWNGTDAKAVKTIWAEKLGGFGSRPECIKAALNALDDHPFPPTLPEFIGLCRNAARRIDDSTAAITYKPSAEEAARHREMSHKAVAAVRAKEFDGLLWAKKPKSHIAMAWIYDAKKKANRFPALANIFDQLVKDGIATAEGQLINRWDGVQWVKA